LSYRASGKAGPQTIADEHGSPYGRPVPWHPAALGFWGVLETLVDLEEHEGGDHDGG